MRRWLCSATFLRVLVSLHRLLTGDKAGLTITFFALLVVLGCGMVLFARLLKAQVHMIIRRCRMRLWSLESLTNKSMFWVILAWEEHTIWGNPQWLPFLAFKSDWEVSFSVRCAVASDEQSETMHCHSRPCPFFSLLNSRTKRILGTRIGTFSLECLTIDIQKLFMQITGQHVPDSSQHLVRICASFPFHHPSLIDSTMDSLAIITMGLHLHRKRDRESQRQIYSFRVD